jgi:TonB family protein
MTLFATASSGQNDGKVGGVVPRQVVAIMASVAAHAAIVLALVVLIPAARSITRPAYYVLAWVSSADSGNAGGANAAAAPVGPESDPGRLRERLSDAGEVPAIAPARRSIDASSFAKPETLAALLEDGDASLEHEADTRDGRKGIASGQAQSGSPHGPDATAMATTTGAGSGAGPGHGWGEAHAIGGHNPSPRYPEAARRDNEEGELMLRVLVAASGAVERVELAKSSGFELLDDAALDTVRMRWRFVPAQRDGRAVESWVLVPIRFTLTQARID